MELNNILVVCIGNICRSPMAAALLKQQLGKKDNNNINVSSAGIAAMTGHSASDHAQALVKEYGLDISAHRAIQLVPDMLLKADLVLVMDKTQQQKTETWQPAARGRIFRLGEWDDCDIPDPYGQDEAIYRDVFNLIDQGINSWMERLN